MVTNVTSDGVAEATIDPGWSLVWEGFDPLRERDLESSMTIGNGYLGTRGSLEEGSKASVPATLIAGVYGALPETGHLPELVVAPNWLLFTIWVEGEKLCLESGQMLEHRRTLDLRRGLLIREWLHQDANGRQTRFRSIRFASLADRHAVGMQIWVTPQNYSGQIKVESGIDGDVANADGPASGGALSYLEPSISEAIESEDSDHAGVVFVMRTKETRPRVQSIAIAMAAATRLEVNGIQAQELVIKRGVETSPLKAAETLEWEAALGVTYRLDKLVSIWTSRDLGKLEGAVSIQAVPGLDGRRPHSGAPRAYSEGLDPKGRGVATRACSLLNRLQLLGVEAIESQSEAVWDATWDDAQLAIEPSVPEEHAVRFAMYHLAIAANPEDEHISISARTLSGMAYKGHVFWDTEIFMLPFFTFTHPRAARSLLMYRYWTLPGARGKARAYGYRGAMYAWESADLGTEVTPSEVALPTGGVVKVLSGAEEHHISADIPYAVWQYWLATGDDHFLESYGAEIVLECARFWASRVKEEADGKFHIRKIVGPDEYHEDVDDDAFTNAMAAWTLDCATRIARWMRDSHDNSWAKLASRIRYDGSEEEIWSDTARRMYTGDDEHTALIEQFQSFYKLEQIDLAAFEPRVAPMDILLGRERIQRSQAIKQADVLMLFQLLPDRYSKGAMERNFTYYEPRTSHGSSLSPATHALLAARLGNSTTALRFLKLAADIDLGNSMGNSAGGVHGASCGGLWQALVFGFGGVQPGDDKLRLDPYLPPGWQNLRFTLIYRGRHLMVRIASEPPEIEITMRRAEAPIDVTIGAVNGRVSWYSPLIARCETGVWVLKESKV
jgi:kojibiose phosphorylase